MPHAESNSGYSKVPWALRHVYLCYFSNRVSWMVAPLIWSKAHGPTTSNCDLWTLIGKCLLAALWQRPSQWYNGSGHTMMHPLFPFRKLAMIPFSFSSKDCYHFSWKTGAKFKCLSSDEMGPFVAVVHYAVMLEGIFTLVRCSSCHFPLWFSQQSLVCESKMPKKWNWLCLSVGFEIMVTCHVQCWVNLSVKYVYSGHDLGVDP